LMYEPNVVWSHHEVDVFGVNPSRPEIAAKPIAFKPNVLATISKSTAVDSVMRVAVKGPGFFATAAA